MSDFRLLMIGAMYENGGNTVHRFLDGHPELFVYPYESQLGTRHVDDGLSSLFPVKYRWPAFRLDASPTEDYRAIVDEEMKVRARTPYVSKFREWELDLDDEERLAVYLEHVARTGRSRPANVEAFFRATFETWRDRRASGAETVYVGYSPILTVDAGTILDELPGAHFLHVVRNPWSAYADTKKRPVPLSLGAYLLGWTVTQHHALLFARRHPDRFTIVRFEDVAADSTAALAPLCERLGIGATPSLGEPSWNGRPLDQLYPWGTIRTPTTEANLATAQELDEAERAEVEWRAGLYLEALSYERFLSDVRA